MEFRKYLWNIIILLGLILAVGETVLTMPAAGDLRLVTEEPQNKNTSGNENHCGRKGKFCEIICKNNPSEGGKMCNCDQYALNCSGSSKLIDCNRYIRIGANPLKALNP